MISGIIFTNRLKGLNAPSGCFCHASEPQSCHGNNMIPITFAKFNKHWLRMISVAVPELKDKAGIFWREANELNLIFHIPRVNDWIAGKLVYPIYTEIATSGTCNHRCTYCALDYMEYQHRFLDTKILK